MVRGPIDFFVIGFGTSDFDGSIITELEQSVKDNVISVIDVAVVSKNTNGVVTKLDVTNLGESDMSMFIEKYQTSEANLDGEDIDEIGEVMEPDTTAAVLVIEHVWARKIKKAILDKKGFLIAEGRIHPEEALKIEKGE